MRIGILRTAGWCTLGTLASPSCGREIQFYKVNSWIFTFRAPGDSRPSFEPILHKSRRKDLQVGQEDRETRLNGLVVVREAGEQEAGKPSYAIPTNTKIDAGANFRDGAQEKLTSLRIYFICDAENRLEGARSRPYRPERPILCHPSKRLPA